MSWLNIWDYILDDAAIRRISECGDDLSNFKGNILAWNPSEWVKNGKINTTTINDKDLCDDPLEKNYIIIPQQQSVKVSRKICEKLGKKNEIPGVLTNVILTCFIYILDTLRAPL